MLFLYIFCKNIKYFEFYINTIKQLFKLNLKNIVYNTIRILFNQFLRKYTNNCFKYCYR